MFCREAVDLLRRACDEHAAPPPVLIVSPASVEANDEFFVLRWPAVRVVADPELRLFDGFGRMRGRAAQIIGPRVWGRALARGLRFGIGRPRGDATRMPGTFVVRGAEILHAHEPPDIATQPDFGALLDIARAAAR